jgi:hypothetical protein
MVLQEQVKLYSPELLPITLIAPSSESQDLSLSKSISEREQGWSENYLLWLGNIRLALSSLTRSIPLEVLVWRDKEEIHRFNVPCWSY